jgi:peptidoglycan LD-endopeptidase CwlK
MRDAVSIPRVKRLHPKVVNEVFETIGQIEASWPLTVAIRIVQGLRTIKEQNDLYAQGRTKPGKKVTNAKGGSSFHNYGLALDFALLFDKDGNGSYETLSWDERHPHWQEVVKAFEAKGWFWGGKFSTIHDAPHLQKTFGLSWQKCLVKYNDKDFIPGTEYINL